jgi:NADPH:quinone reductase
MRALLCETLSDDLSGVRVSEQTMPEPAPGQLRIAMRAAAFNFPDLLMTRGAYQAKPPLPFGLGMEGCGMIEAGDPARLGERVIVSGLGTMATHMLVDVKAVRPAPAALSDAEAAGLTVTGQTAWVGLIERGNLKAGERVLILGAGSGVSQAAIALAKAMGAIVIAAASSQAKLADAQVLGADHVFVLPRGGLTAAELKTLVGQPVDVVYDPLGSVHAEPALRCLAWGGRYLIIGFAAGGIPSLPINLALLKGVSIIGVRAGEASRRDAALAARTLAGVDALAAAGQLKPVIGARGSLDDAKAMLRAMEAGSLSGKAVVTF